MWINKHQIENIQLQNRIKELEEIICPCGQHNWVKVEGYCKFDGIGNYEEPYYDLYQCKNCKKIKRG